MAIEKRIVACINGISKTGIVCDYAVWFSKLLNKNLSLFHTVTQQKNEMREDLSGAIGLGTTDDLMKELVDLDHEQNKIQQKKSRVFMEAAKRRVEKNGISDVQVILEHGRLLENLNAIKDQSLALVVGRNSQTTHQSDSHIGHQLEAIIRKTELPILVVNRTFAEPKNIAVAYDGSDSAKKALRFLIDNKLFISNKIHVVHLTADVTDSADTLSEARSQLAAGNYNLATYLISSQHENSLTQFITENDIDMIVMGAYGHSWVRNLIVGSFTSRVLNSTEKPILLVR